MKKISGLIAPAALWLFWHDRREGPFFGVHMDRKNEWIKNGLGILFALLVAAFFRFYQLGESSFRADTIMFYDLCHRPLSAWAIMTNWMELVGVTAQFPFPLAMAKGMINALHLDPTDFNIRLSSAMFGVITVIPAFYIGYLLRGRWFGLLIALLIAINPFHIQLTREAYFYAPMILGLFMQIGATLWVVRQSERKTRLPWPFFLVTGLGVFLAAYSHMFGWYLTMMAFLMQSWVMIVRSRRSKLFWNELAALIGIYVIIGLPLLFADWGLPFFLRSMFDPEVIESNKKILHTEFIPVWEEALRLGAVMGWGHTWIRGGFTILTAAIGLGVVVRRWREPQMIVLMVMMVFGFVIYEVAHRMGGHPLTLRHASFLFPAYQVWLALGIGALWEFSPACSVPARRLRQVFCLALVVMAIVLALPPAWAGATLIGKPIPFKQIGVWCDTHLPPHSLVLVERWFDPWNELRVHNSTNVNYTFTVPSEPDDMFQQYNWPATAKSFFQKFPDSAYLEYCNSERAKFGVVTNWQFARQMVFTNEPAIKLAKWGLAYRDEFYDLHTNRLETTIFYNMREDVLAQARARGESALVLFGPEWGYVKLWQQLKDFRDWRIMEKQAELDVYNLTDTTNRVSVKVRGMALNGGKHVEWPGGHHDFTHLKLTELALADVQLNPGLNRIRFSDASWNVSRIPLLVDQVVVIPTNDGR